MLIDARSIENNKIIETDICIVGAGLAGLTIAKELINCNIQVCLLEGGGMKPDKKTQSLYKGKNIGHPYFTLDSARARYMGGSVNRWHIPIGDDCSGVRMRPLDEIDFEEKSWVPYSGWPFRKSDLEPYYRRAQSLCKLGEVSFDTSQWLDPEKYPLLPFKNNHIKTVLFKFGSRYPFIQDYKEEILKSDNIKTFTYANVKEIETDDTAKKVMRIKVVTLNRKHFYIKAKTFILAAGALEIPRLLLSSNRVQKNGLGNQNDLVGRFFMEHPHFWSGIFVPSNERVLRYTNAYDHIHIINATPVIAKLALSEDTIRREKLLNFVAELSPRIILKSMLNQFLYPSIKSKSVQAFKKMGRGLIHFSLQGSKPSLLSEVFNGFDDILITAYRGAKKRILKLVDRKHLLVYRLANMSEQAPNPESRVMLSDELDDLGMRRIKLNWQLSDIDIQSAIRSQEILDREFREAGLGHLYIELNEETPPDRIKGGWHHMGTTRMHDDPRKGVVDKNCKVHGISNLYIAGPSVFPTSGYANPSLTIVALSIRLAEHVKNIMMN